MPEIWFPNLGIEIDRLNRVAFTLFGLDVYWYGIFIGAGIILGTYLAMRYMKKIGGNPDNVLDFMLYAIVFCIIGARLYYVVFSWDLYKDNLLDIFNLRKGGLAIYGGIIAAVIFGIFYVRKRRLNFWDMADVMIPSVPLGQAIGRWGNFFNREAFGGVARDKNPWAMRIYFDENYDISQVPDVVKNGMEALRGKALSEIGYIQVQPTFLYESLWNLFVLIIMLIFRRKKKFDGEVILWYLIGYGIGRAVIEGMRTDQLIMPVTGWPVSQALSIVVATVSVIVVIVKRRKIAKAE